MATIDSGVLSDLPLQSFVRRPFEVEAIQITVENIHELSELIGEFCEDERGPYIQADREKVPTVEKVVPGYWLTKMGPNIRCYSNKTFEKQFVPASPLIKEFIEMVAPTPPAYSGRNG